MRKNATKIAALALTLALTVTSVNIPTNASAATVKLNKKKATLYVSGAKSKKTTTLKVTGTKKKVTFTSNKKSVATVNKKGKVTAKKAGKATITAKVGKKSYKCTVTVKKKYTPVTSVSVSPKTVSLKVGKTKTIKATVKPSKPTEKGVTYKSSKTSVATVSSKGKITAKKAGKATITVTAKGASKSGSNKKATVAVTVTKDDTKPTDAPSTAPSDAPTDAPSTAPTDAPSEAPKTLPEMTEAKAIDTDKIEATFASDVPADTEITVTKDGANIDGTATKEGAKATFVSKSKFAVGTYTITAKLGDATVSKEVVVSAEHVEEIKVTSTQALLKADGKKKTAIVYYDVYNQYGTSMRGSTSITWTASSGNVKANKSTGRLEVTRTDAEFRYGDKLYLVGVDAKSGKTAQAEVAIGLEQAIDSVEFIGFLNTKGTVPATVKDLPKELPADFPAKTYVMLYSVKDQDNQVMDASTSNIENPSGAAITFTSDNPMVLDGSKIKDGSIYTVDGTEYSSATMEPGMNAGKGGEVNLLVISNKTGKQSKINFVVGAAKSLKTFTIGTPSKTVADGDQWVSIPFEATDTEGKSVKNYETIVRSTNTLTLGTSDSSSELWLQENEDGTAALYWSDSLSANAFDNNSAFDNMDRNVSLYATVINGEGSNIMLPVSDMRRPVTVSKVKLNDDDADALVERATASVDITSDKVTYLDQYNEPLASWIAEAFFKQAATGKVANKHFYGVKADVADNADKHMGLASDSVAIGTNARKNINYTATAGVVSDKKVVTTDPIKYSVVECSSNSSTVSDWDETGKALNVSYTVVPMTKLSNVSLKAITKLQLDTDMSSKENGNTISGSALDVPATGSLNILNKEALNARVGVTGVYASKTLTVPSDFYEVVTGGAFEVDGDKINKIADKQISWDELYDANSARYTRKDAVKRLSVNVYNNTAKTGKTIGTPSTNVKVSDGASVPTEIQFTQWDSGVITSGKVTPTDLVAPRFDHKQTGNAWWSNNVADDKNNIRVIVLDQYGAVYKKGGNFVEVEFAISDVKENTDEFAHVPNSFMVSGNNSKDAEITGAEIKDTFKLTATVVDTSVTASIPVTVTADSKAKISTKQSNDTDKDFRKDKLGYTR